MSSYTSDANDDEASPRIIVEIQVPAAAVGLAAVLTDLPQVTVEAEQLVPNSHDPLPYLWVKDVDPAAFEAAVGDDASITALHRTANFEEGVLYGVDWNATDETLRAWLHRHDIPILQTEAHADTEAWHLKLRLDSREELSTMQTYLTDNDVAFELLRLYPLTRPKMSQFNVSEKQLVAVLAAYEMGYFEIPRDCRLADVADRLDRGDLRATSARPDEPHLQLTGRRRTDRDRRRRGDVSPAATAGT